jgi:hypothetical protein
MMPLIFPEARPSGVPQQTIWIFGRQADAYLGLNDSNVPSAIFPLEGRMPVMGRSFGAVRLEFRSNLRIEMSGAFSLPGCAILTCEDRTLMPTFSALIEALGTRLRQSAGRTAQDFTQFLGGWERLFQRRRRLSADEEQALWGELVFMSLRPSADNALYAWRKPRTESFNFQAGGIAFDVRTSGEFGLHRISYKQMLPPAQPGKIFLVSQWAVEDVRHGTSLGQLVDSLTSRVSDKILFEEKLMETGYSRADAALYDSKFILLEPPFLLDAVDVPRARALDPGVLELSYSIQLDRNKQISETDEAAILECAFG